MSADGHAVVSHDDALRRITRVEAAVSALSLDDLRSFTLDKGQKLPTLSDVMESLRGRCGLHVEREAPGS